MKYALLFSAAVFVLIFLTSCKDKLPNQDDPTSIVLPDSNLSYSRDIERVWSAWCVGCHAGTNDPNLLPPSYDNLRYYKGLIVGGDGSNSPLVWMLEGTAQPQMPPGSQKLTQNQINGIKKWIDEGAVNN